MGAQWENRPHGCRLITLDSITPAGSRHEAKAHEIGLLPLPPLQPHHGDKNPEHMNSPPPPSEGNAVILHRVTMELKQLYSFIHQAEEAWSDSRRGLGAGETRLASGSRFGRRAKASFAQGPTATDRHPKGFRGELPCSQVGTTGGWPAATSSLSLPSQPASQPVGE